ncbi:MAG: MarR family winged helix-turn-helix transcriptional regulator [Steroidobacteraceae bacterium]
MQTLLIAQARAAGLGLLDFLVLLCACDEAGVVPREAGRALGLSSGTMTGLADRLERDRLIRRTAHPTDRRLRLLVATDAGRRRRDDAVASTLDQLRLLAQERDPPERAGIVVFLRRLGSLAAESAAQLPTREMPAETRRSNPRRPRRG